MIGRIDSLESIDSTESRESRRGLLLRIGSEGLSWEASLGASGELAVWAGQ